MAYIPTIWGIVWGIAVIGCWGIVLGAIAAAMGETVVVEKEDELDDDRREAKGEEEEGFMRLAEGVTVGWSNSDGAGSSRELSSWSNDGPSADPDVSFSGSSSVSSSTFTTSSSSSSPQSTSGSTTLEGGGWVGRAARVEEGVVLTYKTEITM